MCPEVQYLLLNFQVVIIRHRECFSKLHCMTVSADLSAFIPHFTERFTVHRDPPYAGQVTTSAPSHEVIAQCFAASVIASHEAAPSTYSSASVTVTYLLPKDHNY